MCSLEDAKSDFESVIKLKPNHSSAAKELSSLTDLQNAFQQLQQLQEAHAAASTAGGALPDVSSARQVLDRVYSLAPDCIPAQLMDAKLEMMQGNYEQVRVCVCDARVWNLPANQRLAGSQAAQLQCHSCVTKSSGSLVLLVGVVYCPPCV